MSVITYHVSRIASLSTHKSIAVVVALASGLFVALAPLPWSVALGALLAGGALLLAVLYEPLVGLALALVLGPLKALVGVAFPELAAADPGQIFLALALASWALRGLARRDLRLPRMPVTLPVLGYTAIAAVSLWAATDLPNGLKELIKWVEIVLVAALVVDASRRRHIGWALAAALLAGVVQAGVGVWQFGLRGHGPGHFEIQSGFYRAYGAFEQPNPFGGFMGMVWPVAAGIALALILDSGMWNAECGMRSSISNLQSPTSSLKSRLTFLALAAVAVLTGLALILSFSRGAWLGAAAAAGALLVFWPRKRAVGLALGVAAAMLAFGLLRSGVLPASITGRLDAVGEVVQAFSERDVRGAHIEESNFSLLERIAHWQAAVGMASARPWLGVGIGNWDAVYADFDLLNWEAPLGHAHNVYLNVLAETGLLGLAAYLAMWLAIAGVTLRAVRSSAGWRRGLAVGLLGVWAHLAVHQLVDNLYVNNLHLYFGALLGALAWLHADARARCTMAVVATETRLSVG